MSELEEVSLAYVANYAKDKVEASVLTASNYISTENMLVDRAGITSSNYVPEYGNVCGFRENDILVSNIRPYFKKIWFADKHGGCSNDVIVFRSKSNVYPKYLYYQLSQNDFFDFMMAGSNGTKMPRGNRNSIPHYRFLLPSLSTQRRIASILSAYDDLIEKNLKRIKLLEELAQRTYEEWFVKFRVNGEAFAIDKQTVLPEGWEKKRLVDLLTLNYGKALKADERRFGNFPVYGSSGVVGFHESFLVKGPGIIVGRKGNVGSVFWCEKNFHPIDTVYYVDSDISHYFLYFNLKKQNFINNDAAVPGLNRNAAYMADSFLPPNDLLESFDALVRPSFDSIENFQNQNSLLKQSRDILLPRLMNGTISVGQAEESFAMAAEPEEEYNTITDNG